MKNAIAFLLLLCFPLLFACSGQEDKGPAERTAPVRLAVAETRDVPRILEAVGNVEAFSSVQVKSQVGGQIVDVLVRAGEAVNAGDILFRLDPRPFDAAVAEVEARLTRGEALLAQARQDLARQSSLRRQDVVSQEAFDQALTAEKTIQADIKQAQAALQIAKLNREFSEIKAPVSGRIGDILVRLGNVIRANDERPLVVINSIRPAEVSFTLAERHLPAILHLLQAGALEVGVLPEGDTGPLIMGEVTAVNNEVDRMTGSIRLFAAFPNDDYRLWPGQFVRITLVMAMLNDAVLVPERAVQMGMAGPFVYLAAPDPQGRKDLYRVTLSGVESEPGPRGYVVISKGVSAGDVIVVEGQLGLSPGALAMDVGERR